MAPITANKSVTVATANNGNGVVNLGDMLEYSVTVDNGALEIKKLLGNKKDQDIEWGYQKGQNFILQSCSYIENLTTLIFIALNRTISVVLFYYLLKLSL